MGVSVKTGLRGIVISLVVIIVSVFFFFGCGKSADEMYRQGKEMVGKTETQAQGMEMLNKFVKKHPKDSRAPSVMLAIANIHMNLRQYSEAETAYKLLLEKYPKSAEAYNGMFLLGYMYFDGMKDNAKAKDILGKFVAAYPDSGLTVSAKVLLENIGLPVEQWSTVRNIMKEQDADTTKNANAKKADAKK
jgi:TolA-binding protein